MTMTSKEGFVEKRKERKKEKANHDGLEDLVSDGGQDPLVIVGPDLRDDLLEFGDVRTKEHTERDVDDLEVFFFFFFCVCAMLGPQEQEGGRGNERERERERTFASGL